MADERVITVPRIPFLVGDARDDLFITMAEDGRMMQSGRLRPLYGPEDATGRRPLVGALDREYVERFTEVIACAHPPQQESPMPDELKEQITFATKGLEADLTLPLQTRTFLIHMVDALSAAHARITALEKRLEAEAP